MKIGMGRRNKKFPRNILLLCALAFFYTISLNYLRIHRALRIWSGITPFIIEFNYLQCRQWVSTKVTQTDDTADNYTVFDSDVVDGHRGRMKRFHERAAPRLTSLLISLGGTCIKIGQILSLLVGVLPEPYIESLQSVHYGVPPRDYAEIGKIIESSTGRRMDDIFEEFEEVPIGVASIGQAHRAVLKLPEQNLGDDGTKARVIVKVQYPEVVENFRTDFNIFEIAGRLVNIGHTEFLRAVRERHEKELDFRIEAQNLREVQANMRRHGFEPGLVRIPSVRNETGLCNEQVLVMEYLEGVTLKVVMEEEHAKFAKGLGFGEENGVAELKMRLRKMMLEHFENGGGGTGSRMVVNSNLLPAIVPTVAKIIRFYGGTKQKVENAFSMILRRKSNVQEPKELEHSEKSTLLKPKRIDLTHVIKTIVRIHGHQVLVDGVFNVDPHPGNILILPDGRLGLLDYGMVGRYNVEERQLAAGVISAIARGDKEAVREIYDKAGYRAYWKEGSMDQNILYRLASLHFDRLDLSDVAVTASVKSSGGDERLKRKIPLLEILQSATESYTPIWIENGRRLSTVLYCTANEAMRPISLSKEWKDIATQVLRKRK